MEEEAEVSNAMPRGFHSAQDIAREMGRPLSEVARHLERMADKGLCVASREGGCGIAGPPLVPGLDSL